MHADSSTGSELKADEEACREVLERSEHSGAFFDSLLTRAAMKNLEEQP